MRLGWAIVAGLVLGGGIGWWLIERDRKPPAPGPTVAPPAAAATTTPGPRLYRWRDADGVLQVSDTPPASGEYEEVKIRSDRNVVPMTAPVDETPAPGG